MNNKQTCIGLLILGVLCACTPEKLTEELQAEDPTEETLLETGANGLTPSYTGDDQSLEPDNEKDG